MRLLCWVPRIISCPINIADKPLNAELARVNALLVSQSAALLKPPRDPQRHHVIAGCNYSWPVIFSGCNVQRRRESWSLWLTAELEEAMEVFWKPRPFSFILCWVSLASTDFSSQLSS